MNIFSDETEVAEERLKWSFRSKYSISLPCSRASIAHAALPNRPGPSGSRTSQRVTEVKRRVMSARLQRQKFQKRQKHSGQNSDLRSRRSGIQSSGKLSKLRSAFCLPPVERRFRRQQKLGGRRFVHKLKSRCVSLLPARRCALN